MPFVIYTDTLTQLPPETDADFNTRVLQYITDQQFYFESAGGSLPVTSTPSQGAYLGFPPGCNPAWFPGEGMTTASVWDPVAGQMVRQVTFLYDNTYYYKYLGTVPALPPPSPLPTAGEVAMFDSTGALSGAGITVSSGTLDTTDATLTTIQTIPIASLEKWVFRVTVKCIKTAGAGVGAIGDTNAYVRTFKASNAGGAVTLGTVQNTFTDEAFIVGGITVSVSGTNILVRVTGAVNDDISWTSKAVRE